MTLKESGDCRVFFSEYQLVEILVNLIQNAQEAIIEAGRSDGRIAVEMFRDDNAVIIRISDNGAGIPRKEERRIFEAFYSTKKIGKNWGLGLSYAALAVAAHGGLILLKSKQGKGTVFELVMHTADKKRRRKAA